MGLTRSGSTIAFPCRKLEYLMVISDLLQKGHVWIDAATQLSNAAMQLAMAESDIAPVFAYGSFSGLFIPSAHWNHIINPEFRDRACGRVYSDGPPRGEYQHHFT